MSLPPDWDITWDKASGYTPVDYSRPWEAEGWGSDDVIVTGPTKLQVAQAQADATPILPQKPGFRQGQKDYEYMSTEKEQRRERRAQAKDLAEARGRSWRDTPLPIPLKAEPKVEYPDWRGPKIDYPDWRDTPLPTPREDIVIIQPAPEEREVTIQPVPIPEDDKVWSGGSRDFDERTGTYRPGHRRRERAFNVRDTWRRPASGRGFSTSATQPLRRRESSMWDVFGRR